MAHPPRCARLVILLAIVLGGCESGEVRTVHGGDQDTARLKQHPPFPPDYVVGEYSRLVPDLRVPAQVLPGHAVRMEVVVRNQSERIVVLEAGDSASTFDLVVLRPDGTKIWNLLARKDQLLVLKWRVLAPDQEVRFADIWNQRDERGNPVLPGMYYVYGVLDTKGYEQDLATPLQVLTIIDPNTSPDPDEF